MINFDDPMRSDVEKIIFPTQATVDTRFKRMDEVLELILSSTLEQELLDINKQFLTSSLAFESIQNDGRDLSAYITAAS